MHSKNRHFNCDLEEVICTKNIKIVRETSANGFLRTLQSRSPFLLKLIEKRFQDFTSIFSLDATKFGIPSLRAFLHYL